MAAYARVSTDNTEQLISLEAQKVHYEAYIKANPDWEFVGIYFDEGISGTKKENRTELLRLISSCEINEYDEQLVRRIIEKVTVFDDKLIIGFKSGVVIDVEI